MLTREGDTVPVVEAIVYIRERGEESAEEWLVPVPAAEVAVAKPSCQ